MRGLLGVSGAGHGVSLGVEGGVVVGAILGLVVAEALVGGGGRGWYVSDFLIVGLLTFGWFMEVVSSLRRWLLGGVLVVHNLSSRLLGAYSVLDPSQILFECENETCMVCIYDN